MTPYFFGMEKVDPRMAPTLVFNPLTAVALGREVIRAEDDMELPLRVNSMSAVVSVPTTDEYVTLCLNW